MIKFIPHLTTIRHTKIGFYCEGPLLGIELLDLVFLKHLAYEYAKGGACLVLVARREKQLQEVACKARRLGSPDVIVETGDVSKVEDCKRFIDAALNHFGKLNHVVNNAGIAPLCLFEDADNVEDFAPIMVGADGVPVESTEGCSKAIFKSICRGDRGYRKLLPMASKRALVSFYETLRTEVGSDIGITIVALGAVDSEITRDQKRVLYLGRFLYPINIPTYASSSLNSSMDSIHKLLNIVLPLVSLFSLFFFLPPILPFKISSSILRSVFWENVVGKVVLITGASSGIGEV
ncbi:hypothetical protein C3L33_00503, partial [Rhododendron williamsianum]